MLSRSPVNMSFYETVTAKGHQDMSWIRAKLLEHEAHHLLEKSEPFADVSTLGAIVAPLKVLHTVAPCTSLMLLYWKLRKEERGHFQEPARLYAQTPGCYFHS